jgi:hypothetical protein
MAVARAALSLPSIEAVRGVIDGMTAVMLDGDGVLSADAARVARICGCSLKS